MADGDTTTPDATTLDPALINRLLQQTLNPQAMPSPTAPSASSHEGRGLLSLFGEALGGGEQYGTTAEREQGGLRALQSAGLNMLLNSDYSVMPHSLGSIVASGLGGAQRSLGETQAVSAAQQSAALEYQQKQQEMQLARIKEAVPLLTLLQGQQRLGALGNLPSSLGGTTPPTGTNIATGGSIAAPLLARDTSMTAGQQANNSGNLMMAPGAPAPAGAIGAVPVSGGRYVAAFPDAATGIAAQSDNLTAYQTQHGINTIRGAVTRWVGDPKADLGSYAADIAKLAGVDPDAKVDLSDPKIQRAFFIAQQPHESGKAWLKPEDVDKGIALAAARRGGGTQAATPPAAPTVQTPPAPTLRAPVGTPADALPAGGATVAGPAGAATVGAPRPAGPAVPGDVNAMIAGMTRGGANPTTLAAGGAQSAPQAPAQVATTAPVVPQTPPTDQTQPAPGGPPVFNYAARQPPPGLIQGGALTPDEQRVVQDARNSYGVAIRAASLIPDAAKAAEARAQAEATLQGTLDKELSARTGRTDAGAKQLTDWYAEDYKQQEAVHKALLDNYYQNQNEQTKQNNAIALENLKAENTRRQNVDSAVVGVSTDRLKDLQTRAGTSQRIIRDTSALEPLATQMGDANTLLANNPKLRDALISLKLPGLAGADMNELRAQQAWDKIVTGFFQDTHVAGSGSQSDREGEWMMRQFGGTEQTPEDRLTQLAIIRKLGEQRVADHRDAEDLFMKQNGKLSGLDDRIAQRKQLFDRPPQWNADNPQANLAAQNRYVAQHPRGEPFAAWTSTDGGRTPGEMRYFRNEMVTDPRTGKARLQPVPLLGGALAADQ